MDLLPSAVLRLHLPRTSNDPAGMPPPGSLYFRDRRANSLNVIPGRLKGEPGISRGKLQIPGSPLPRCPGMTETNVRATRLGRNVQFSRHDRRAKAVHAITTDGADVW